MCSLSNGPCEFCIGNFEVDRRFLQVRHRLKVGIAMNIPAPSPVRPTVRLVDARRIDGAFLLPGCSKRRRIHADRTTSCRGRGSEFRGFSELTLIIQGQQLGSRATRCSQKDCLMGTQRRHSQPFVSTGSSAASFSMAMEPHDQFSSALSDAVAQARALTTQSFASLLDPSDR